MKKWYILGIIGLLLGIGLTPNISADIFPRVDDNTMNVQPGPGIEIKYPTPGFYLFGNKLMNLSIIFIIGAFTIEAGGYFSDEGIHIIEFYLDDKLIGERIESPFSCYCAVKHLGKGTIKAIAYDLADNSDDDTLDVYYYKFL